MKYVLGLLWLTAPFVVVWREIHCVRKSREFKREQTNFLFLKNVIRCFFSLASFLSPLHSSMHSSNGQFLLSHSFSLGPSRFFFSNQLLQKIFPRVFLSPFWNSLALSVLLIHVSSPTAACYDASARVGLHTEKRLMGVKAKFYVILLALI